MAPGGTHSSPGQHCQTLSGGAPRHRILPRHWGCAGRVGTASARGQGAEPHRPPGVYPGVGWGCVCVCASCSPCVQAAAWWPWQSPQLGTAAEHHGPGLRCLVWPLRRPLVLVSLVSGWLCVSPVPPRPRLGSTGRSGCVAPLAHTHARACARAGDKSHRVPGSPPVSRCTAGGSQSSSRSRCLPVGQLVFHGGAVSTQRGELLPAQTWSCPQGQNWAKGRGVGQSPLLGLG